MNNRHGHLKDRGDDDDNENTVGCRREHANKQKCVDVENWARRNGHVAAEQIEQQVARRVYD